MIKILKSAVANAENNHNLDVDDLVVAQAWTGKDMVLKRFHARGRGRGARILKPFSEADDRRCASRRKKRREESQGQEGRQGQSRAPRASRQAAKKEAA